MEVLEQIEQVLTRAESMHVMFITDMDATDLRNHVASLGWEYVYINISGSEDAKDTLVKTIYNNCMKGRGSHPIIGCDEYEVFDYLNNCEKKYVVHLHPTEELLNQLQLVAWLDTIALNRKFPNVRVVVIVQRNSELKNHELLRIFKKKYLELRGRKMPMSILCGSYDLRDSDVVSTIRNITNRCDNELTEPVGDEQVLESLRQKDVRIIALVDSNYLYSMECMYKTACVVALGKLKERLFPIIIEAKEKIELFQAEVFSFWNDRLSDLKERIKQNPTTSQEKLLQEKKCVAEIVDRLDDIWNLITSNDVYTDSNFERDLVFFITGEPNKNNIIANINKNIDPMEKNTMPEIIINGGNPQVNINAGSDAMTVYNDHSIKSTLTEEDVIKYLEEHNLVAVHQVHISTDEAVFEEAKKICFLFKDLVEKNQASSLFLRDSRNSDESDWQYLLFIIAKAFAKGANGDYHISREDNPGPGEIDMHFTRGSQANVCVEMKVSGNSELVHGYKEQLKGYMQAEGAKYGLYIIVKQDEQHQSDIEEVQKLSEVYAQNGDWYAPIVILVDGRKQLSASKHSYKALPD